MYLLILQSFNKYFIVALSVRHHMFLSNKANNLQYKIQGGSNMTGTDLYVNKPHCAAAVRP